MVLYSDNLNSDGTCIHSWFSKQASPREVRYGVLHLRARMLDDACSGLRLLHPHSHSHSEMRVAPGQLRGKKRKKPYKRPRPLPDSDNDASFQARPPSLIHCQTPTPSRQTALSRDRGHGTPDQPHRLAPHERHGGDRGRLVSASTEAAAPRHR